MGVPTYIGELGQSDDLLRLAVEAVPTGILIADHSGKIILVNAQTEKLFGYRRDELLGENVEMLVPQSLRRNHANLRDGFLLQPETRPMGAGRDLFGRRKDGSLFPVEIGLNPVRREEGTWVLAAIVDVTERKRIEAALRESEQRFRSIADSVPVMIWISGPDKLCTFFNKPWLTFTGRGMEQELGNGWAEGIHPSDLDRCLDIYTTSFDASRNFEMEYRLRRADGEYRWILSQGVPRFSPEGVFVGYIGSCIDITEIKRRALEQLAQQRIERLGTVARGVAHDVGNLLSGIIAHADLALEDVDDPSARESIETIKNIAKRGSELVRDLMLYAGEDKGNVESLDISLVVEEMLNLLRASVPKHTKLSAALDRHLPTFLANPSHIRQVVLNLVINASEAIEEQGGAIHVTTSRVTRDSESAPTLFTQLREGDYVRLEVSDTGRGMTNEVQAKIFDPFFTTKDPGRGLGLAVIQGIVQKYHGVIKVRSAPGRGTTFEVLFPCTQPT